MKETDLYLPVKNFLENLGYVVKGEIGSIDVFAMKEDLSIAIELKVNINLKLIYQAIDRQRFADEVFIAVPIEAIKSHRKNLKKFKLLLRRLSLGLLIVDKDKVETAILPKDYNLTSSRNHNKRKRDKLISDFKNIQGNNQGGLKGKRMTLYREKVIKIAQVLEKNPGLSPKEIKEITNIENTYSILQKNYYNWFERKAYASYGLTEEGRDFVAKETT